MLCLTLTRDRPLTTGNERFAYSLTVVHFRKVVIRQKVGFIQNGHPVITLCFISQVLIFTG